ncbi:acyl-CoA N-acyltransferase [Polychaeton citri CBS 116435]|uniref:Acyl-CoA N-acyltransferase n=1 Tax=Polychaeton citri CBS 116435 TaxID=1314669 RepID=A0A9P4Q5Y6_9PEZI|nr:acyl-CoA N-acyltransferase [Polychaeton citri CBS 116435]
MASTSHQPGPNINPRYVAYGDESQKHYESPFLPAIRHLISTDLSEPYSIYVYRYFLYQWPDLCFMALDEKTDALIGVIISKIEPHRGGPNRGYIAMLATSQKYRGQGIAGTLVQKALDRMVEKGADEVALETEVDNIPSLRIYEKLGFLRTKRLHRYYLNGNTAFRLVLYLKSGIPWKQVGPPQQPPDYLQGDGYGAAASTGSATDVRNEDSNLHSEREP